MKLIRTFLLTLGIIGSLGMPISICAQKSARKPAPEPNNAWEWVEWAKRYSKKPEEVMSYFRGHSAEFGSLPKANQDRADDVLFFVTNCAYRTQSAEFESLLGRSQKVAEDFVTRRDMKYSVGALNQHHELLRRAVEVGEYELALRIADWAQKLRDRYFANPASEDTMSMRFDPAQDMSLRSLYKSVGDYETVERLLRDGIKLQTEQAEKMKAQLRKAGVSGLMSMPDTLPNLLKPELADALARQGKMQEALVIVDSLQKSGGAMKNLGSGEAGAMIKGFLGDGLSARDGILFSEVWLANGQADKALKALEVVQQKQKTFVDKFGAMNSGKTNPLAEYEKVAAAKVLDLKTRCLWQLGRVQEAVESQELMLKITGHLPPDHPDMINARISRAWGWLALQKTAEAKKEAGEIAKDQTQAVADLMRFASVRQRMIYLQQADPFSLLIATGQTSLLAEAVLRLKGVVLDSVLEEQRLARESTNAEAKTLLQQLARLRKELTDVAVGRKGDAETLRRQIEATESRLAGITSARLDSREALTVTAEQVQAALSAGDAVVEFIRYREMVKPGHWQSRYGALVIRPGQPVSWQPLGDSAETDRLVDGLLNQMKGMAEAKVDEALEKDLKALYDRLLAPVEPAVIGARRLILAPDGNLGRISMAVLMSSERRFASERWELSYISSARDLLRSSSPEGIGPAEMLLIADPDYDENGGENTVVGDSRGMPMAFDRSNLPVLARLEGTRREMESLTSLLNSQGVQVRSFAGKEAREEVLSRLTISPRYLHLATHGFVLNPTAAIESAARGSGGGGIQEAAIASAMPIGPVAPAISDNPLQRAVLALAGANSTFAKWKSGEIPSAASDGVLSAAEVATMDLSNTWLAVLSACETAAGEAMTSEGVMGMRRGFFLAGVDHLVMTFWPIADEETVQVMADFYKAIGDKVHPATALHRVQRDSLVKWRKEKGLQAAVFLAGPFALSTTGKLPAN